MIVCAWVNWRNINDKIGDILAVGLFGGALPAGFLLVLMAAAPDIAEKITPPLEIGIFGILYIIYALAQIWKKIRG